MTHDDTAVRVLLEGEFSSMASSWTEHLCLQKSGDHVILSSCGYEVLAPLFTLRSGTRGIVDTRYRTHRRQSVVGIEDGDYVVGGDLVPHDDDAEFSSARGH